MFVPEQRAGLIRTELRRIFASPAGPLLARIGNTPLLELKRINKSQRVRFLAKLESHNPSGSVKDRIALYMIADALATGQLTRERVAIEASSGNTGISLAMVGARLGLDVCITVPDNVSVERHKLIKWYGSRPLLTPGELGTAGAIAKAREMSADKRFVWLAQHFNEINSFAHYETTGMELVSQAREMGLPAIDAFVATSGTTGTLMGVSARLKDEFPGVEIVAVWPKDKIMGIRKPIGENRPGIYAESRVDRVEEIANDDAMAMVKTVATMEGLFMGPSGGAAVASAIRAAEKLEREKGGGVVVTLIPDSGERYLSMQGFFPDQGRRSSDRK